MKSWQSIGEEIAWAINNNINQVLDDVIDLYENKYNVLVEIRGDIGWIDTKLISPDTTTLIFQQRGSDYPLQVTFVGKVEFTADMINQVAYNH
jgi:hypothetical protein